MEVEWKEGRAVGLGHMDGSAIEGSEIEGMFTHYGWRPGVSPDGPEEEYSDDEIWGFDPKEQAKNAAARAEKLPKCLQTRMGPTTPRDATYESKTEKSMASISEHVAPRWQHNEALSI
jgi:hypothetical protein